MPASVVSSVRMTLGLRTVDLVEAIRLLRTSADVPTPDA